MTRVLLIGVKPEAVDTSDPDLPPGITTKEIAAQIDATLSEIKARGWQAVCCAIPPDGGAEATIAVNTKPTDSADAAERWLHGARSATTG
ncbi:hypothetical protein tb265_19240 [Gemmatimonadetes bacterium T265]|nr:hypothetical protein tb265_19240 [Gemmatimonadetes bacterium T265]